MKRCGLIILMCLSLLFISIGMASAAPKNQAVFVANSQGYMLNGSVFQMDAAPFTVQDRVLVPLRYLAYALELDEKNVIWDPYGKSVELRTADKKIKLVVNSYTLLVNEKSYKMDVAPVLKDNQVFLPAKWVAEELGYSIGWDERMQALLIGAPENLPDPKSIPLKIIPLNIRPCELSESDLCLNQKISFSSILFYGEYANVYNAGVAANYVNGYVLNPEQEFSFNEVVGERTTQKGFITGYDILDNLTVGGGVCRTSTVLYQVATDAGLTILERHPHYLPVHYTPLGTDASVSYGTMDLRFVNNLPNPIIIYSGLNEEENGRRLWAELCERKILKKIDVAVLIKEPGSCWKSNIEKTHLVALEKDGTSFISMEQIGDLLHLSPEIKLVQGGTSTATVEINNQLISFTEGNKTVMINNTECQLNEAPFCLSNCNCNFWLPFKDWVNLTGGEVICIDSMPSSILLNLSGTSLVGKNL
ncbi:VanW family protein [Pelotomaculum isophthalicicum JI]|uniref:VanW family protein n=1 Tax=Pelotomaculum isophthalicicum JI TaxID=947010 RepID=A0A9X4JTG0_9FIRM|nr:VanW family protein [Pelotomaculum isophthalicicum]MDF9407390.1 VanW family protein [Pelotomaculum isophthalicicum JI]